MNHKASIRQRRKRVLAIALALLAGTTSLTSLASPSACPLPTLAADWQQVGSTRLKVWLWSVYDADLHTDSGDYANAQQRALRLRYLRDIKAVDLVESTAEEWQRLGIDVTATHQQWLAQLQQMWPDVREGDCLMVVEDQQGHAQFFNAQGALGSIPSAQFSDDFFAIWLSENSRFAENRDELVGATQ